MKKLIITLTKNNNTDNPITETFTAKSEANMWTILRGIRNGLQKVDIDNGVKAAVTDEVLNNLYKVINFRMNKKGKIEMPNEVKETCRYHIKKAKTTAPAEQTVA